jgi:hypothetical protein
MENNNPARSMTYLQCECSCGRVEEEEQEVLNHSPFVECLGYWVIGYRV